MNATFFMLYVMKWHSYIRCCLKELFLIFWCTLYNYIYFEPTFKCNIIKIRSSIYTFTYMYKPAQGNHHAYENFCLTDFQNDLKCIWHQMDECTKILLEEFNMVNVVLFGEDWFYLSSPLWCFTQWRTNEEHRKSPVCFWTKKEKKNHPLFFW